MTSKCNCMYCQGPIEFDLADFIRCGETATERLGQKVACPHCGKETILSVLKQPPAPPAPPGSVLPGSLKNCPGCGERISLRARTCPHCGEPFPDQLAGGFLDVMAVIMFIGGGFWWLNGWTGKSENIYQQIYLGNCESTGLILMSIALLIAGTGRLIRK